MPQHPKAGIIIVTWEKREDVLNLLNTLKNLDYDNYDIVVVDNASTDGTAEAVKEAFPGVHIIVNPENLGGTGGFNTGIKYALGKGVYKYLWLLDNDVEVDSRALSELVRVLESSEEIAVAGSAMYDLTDKDKFLEAGYFIDLTKGRFHDDKKSIPDNARGKEFFIVDSISSCSLCVSAEAILDVGIWDENYFIYCDDVDWNIRFGEKGYKVASVPGSRIWHVPWLFKIGFNTAYYANRNMLYLMNKHVPFPKRALGLLYKELSILLLSLKLLVSGDYFHSILTLKSVIDFFDKRFGKFEDLEYIENLKKNAGERPYMLWTETLARLAVKNVTYVISAFLSLIKGTAIEGLRILFKRLPPDTRLKLIDKINNHYLSKRAKCRRS
ncbi:MAG: glycosyltransferase family 2 protein [Deltaproteobacteria bacterium]